MHAMTRPPEPCVGVSRRSCGTIGGDVADEFEATGSGLPCPQRQALRRDKLDVRNVSACSLPTAVCVCKGTLLRCSGSQSTS